MIARLSFVLVTVLACGGTSAATAPARSSTNASAPRRAHVTVSKCVPVGYGFSCTAELDGTPATLEACVGSGDKIGLTPRITPPVELTVQVEPAPESERYCGVLILPAGDHVRVMSVE